MNRAVFVGVNKYLRIAPDLRGCVNDALDLAQKTVRAFGWKNEDIRLILNERATFGEIVQRIRWLMEGNGGGVRWLHFSGHGTRVRDRDGDELLDHLDEALCPAPENSSKQDYWDHQLIKDDLIHKLTLEDAKLDAPPPFLFMSFDSCHSGTVYRDNHPGVVRYANPPDDIKWRQSGWDQRGVSPVIRSLGESATYTKRAVVFSACQDNESATDIGRDGKPCGAFSSSLIKAMDSLTDTDTWEDFFEKTCESCRQVSSQHPNMWKTELEGEMNYPRRVLTSDLITR